MKTNKQVSTYTMILILTVACTCMLSHVTPSAVWACGPCGNCSLCPVYPPANVSAVPTSICSGNSSVLSASPGYGGDVVEWFEGSCQGTPDYYGSPYTVYPMSTTTYYVRTRNSATGCVSSCVSVTVTVTEMVETVITDQPDTQEICIGDNTLFAVAATGGGTLTYQWQKNNVNLTCTGRYSGCTTATLTITSADTNYEGNYRCVVTGNCGSATTDQASLIIAPPGLGTQQSPYEISTLCHLVWLRETVGSSAGKYYVMTADINASDTANWNDPGTSTEFKEGFAPIQNFQGSFDGSGYTIINLFINRPEMYLLTGDCIGLFGSIAATGHVHDLGLVGGDITGEHHVGGLVGHNEGTVSNCYTTGEVTGDSHVGGLVGYNSKGSVSDCYAEGNITGYSSVGGLIGDNNEGDVSDCHATGAVTAEDGMNIGGLVGYLVGDPDEDTGTVSNCYATGTVDAGEYGLAVGGLIGASEGGTVEFCHTGLGPCETAGNVTGGYSVGGLIGDNWWGNTVSQCFATGNVRGHDDVGGLVGWNRYRFGKQGYTTNHKDNAVSDSYATGTVTGVCREYHHCSHIAGLIGRNVSLEFESEEFYQDSLVSRCYCTGEVNVEHVTNCAIDITHCGDSPCVGGLIGHNYLQSFEPWVIMEDYEGVVTYSYWDTQTSGQSTSDGGTGKTTAQMKQSATFVTWDFDDVWNIVEGETYPYLRAFPYLAPFASGEIVARNVFYNNSAYDNNDVDIDSHTGADTDSAAIDSSKSPLMLNGGTSIFANWTGYIKGINGLIYDIELTCSAADPEASDFTFTNIGKDGTGSTSVSPSASAMIVLEEGSPTTPRKVRMVFTFTDNAVKSTWLKVDIGTGFGLPASETHFWGSASGDVNVGNTPTYIVVNASDVLAIRAHPSSDSPVTYQYDINKDGVTDSTDESDAQAHACGLMNCVKFITK